MKVLKKELIRFGAVGFINALIDFSVLNFLLWMFQVHSGSPLLVCNICAFCCANINSYFWNKSWTFRHKGRLTFSEYSRFFWLSLVGLALNSLVLMIMVEVFAPLRLEDTLLWVNFAKIVATLVSLSWNFFAYRCIVFNRAMSK